jgi:hypothetical protein
VSGKFADATTVAIEPGLYGRTADIRYTTDGTEPTAKSAAYRGPIPLSATTNIKAVILSAGGRAGPAAATTIEVDDHTAPTVTRVDAMFKSPTLIVQFSEPVDPATAIASSFTVEPATEATTTVDWVHGILQSERDLVIASRPLEATTFEVDGTRWAYVFYESGLSVNVLYGLADGAKRAVGFKLSDGMDVPDELADRFRFARQKSKLAGTIRGSYFVIKDEHLPVPA